MAKARAAARRKPAKAASRRATALPSFVSPQLATLVDDTPEGDNWLFEIKFDGYRTVTAAAGDRVVCYTRTGLDWSAKYGAIPAALAKLKLDGALLDGEVAVVDRNGRSSFADLQENLKHGGHGLSYFVFDLLALGGQDLRRLPQIERKQRLKALLKKAKPPIFYSDHIVGATAGRAMLKTLCAKQFEGVIAKRADSLYTSRRSHDWLKIKCSAEQEFVIIGYTLSDKDREFSSIVLALNERGQLRYSGRVGTGFSVETLGSLYRKFKQLERDTPPVKDYPREIRRYTRWIEPKLVAQIGFANFTAEGYVRQGKFLGLREDKPATAVKRETPEHL
jgi:bifunctional non-homologous end joining protein LigD